MSSCAMRCDSFEVQTCVMICRKYLQVWLRSLNICNRDFVRVVGYLIRSTLDSSISLTAAQRVLNLD